LSLSKGKPQHLPWGVDGLTSFRGCVKKSQPSFEMIAEKGKI